MRGEYFSSLAALSSTLGSPPLARGIPTCIRRYRGGGGITPACAGNTGSVNLWNYENGDHPRLRGEYYLSSRQRTILTGSPPLARGIHNLLRIHVVYGGITPACAGNTNIPLDRICILEDHPRLRGEYRMEFDSSLCFLGSPPLARGIQSKSKRSFVDPGITPACAGNTLIAESSICISWDHPRLRGEYIVQRS